MRDKTARNAIGQVAGLLGIHLSGIEFDSPLALPIDMPKREDILTLRRDVDLLIESLKLKVVREPARTALVSRGAK